MGAAPALTQGDLTFFSTMAGIAATLMGLSFLALNFFLTGVFKRYRRLALPIFLHEVRRRYHRSRGTRPILLSTNPDPYSPLPRSISAQRDSSDVTDWQLFDGDPLIVFIAFSMSLSWNLYFLALVLGLTVVSGGFATQWILAVETVAFLAFIIYSIMVRHQKYARLDTYRTGEELLWTPGEWLVVLVNLCSMVFSCEVALMQACGTVRDGICAVALPASDFATAESAFLVFLKVLCVLALALGLYVTNKDFFVFMKAKLSDEMRGRWLRAFVTEYPGLAARVADAIMAAGTGTSGDELRSLWNDGCPPKGYIRTELSPAGENDVRWRQLLAGEPTVTSWMFDVPGIAAWVYDLKQRCAEEIPQPAPAVGRGARA